ncbi:MAG: hypothetical protein V7K32_22730 [Nostoc sp.]|uniref:hypothetical protein n=1 Tax=Nostoc sp. TaxID=1180 RepID=UPI002FF56415
MPENIEKHFLKEVRKLKQKNRNRMVQRVGVLLLLVGIVSGFAYLFFQGNPIWKIGNSAISTTSLVFSILGLILFLNIIIYII